MGLDIDLDTEPGGLADQQAGRADPALAEMKVVADRDAADPEPLDQVMVNEILRRGPGPGLVEGHDDGAGEPGSGQQAQLSGLVGQPELGAVRTEKAARMRLERHRQRRPAVGVAHLQGRCNHGAVTEVDAIEIAHGDHGSLRDGGRGRGVADNGEAGRHFRDSSTQGSDGGGTVTWGAQRSQAGAEPASPGEASAFRNSGRLTRCLTADASPLGYRLRGRSGLAQPDCWFAALSVVWGV